MYIHIQMEEKVFKLSEVICERDKELKQVHKDLELTQRELDLIKREKQLDECEAEKKMRAKDEEVIINVYVLLFLETMYTTKHVS